jgi:ribosomal-protein-alanine N-acetyltransferase
MNAQWQPAQPGPASTRRRAMTLHDLDAVLAIEQRAYSFPWSRGNFIDSLAAAYLAEVLVADDGTLLAYFIAMTGVEELHLLNLTVAPPHQGQGLCRRLLAAVRGHGRRLGLANLWLEVRAGNRRAQALYRANGFSEVSLRRAYYPAADGREDAVVMRLSLAGGTEEADVV